MVGDALLSFCSVLLFFSFFLSCLLIGNSVVSGCSGGGGGCLLVCVCLTVVFVWLLPPPSFFFSDKVEEAACRWQQQNCNHRRSWCHPRLSFPIGLFLHHQLSSAQTFLHCSRLYHFSLTQSVSPFETWSRCPQHRLRSSYIFVCCYVLLVTTHTRDGEVIHSVNQQPSKHGKTHTFTSNVIGLVNWQWRRMRRQSPVQCWVLASISLVGLLQWIQPLFFFAAFCLLLLWWCVACRKKTTSVSGCCCCCWYLNWAGHYSSWAEQSRAEWEYLIHFAATSEEGAVPKMMVRPTAAVSGPLLLLCLSISCCVCWVHGYFSTLAPHWVRLLLSLQLAAYQHWKDCSVYQQPSHADQAAYHWQQQSAMYDFAFTAVWVSQHCTKLLSLVIGCALVNHSSQLFSC